MIASAVQPPGISALIDAMLRGRLSDAQAVVLAAAGPEAVRLALLAANARIAQLQTPALSLSTPSGMIPPYQKPPAPRRKKRPGAKAGHAGSRRKTPEKIDERVEHRLDACPCCGGELQRCKRSRTRIIEDIPQEITPVVTEHTIHRDYCPSCQKHVEPVVADAMPVRLSSRPKPTPRWGITWWLFPVGFITALA